MFETVLVAIDGSEAGHAAVRTAAVVAERFGSDVVVLHVLEHKLTWAADIDLESEQEALDLISAAVHDLKQTRLPARGEVVHASSAQTAQVIVDAAERVGASLVVMGTRGLGNTKALLLGSVAHDVLHRARCPVMVTPDARDRTAIDRSGAALHAVS